jgi:hypothetical protein
MPTVELNVTPSAFEAGDAAIVSRGGVPAVVELRSAAVAEAADFQALLAVNAQTGTTYTLALADNGRVVTAANADPVGVTVPLNSSVAFPVGAAVNVIWKGGGVVTVSGASGVTVNGADAGSVEIAARWQGVALLKVATNEWIASGAIA